MPWNALIAVVLVGMPSLSLGADRWSDPFPGVRHLHRTGAGRLSLHAAVIDLCAAGVRVRHTAFEERGQRTSQFASSVGAQVAINGDWSCRPVDVGPQSEFASCRGLPAYTTYAIAAHAGQVWPGSFEQAAMLAFAPGRVESYDWQAHAPARPWMSEVISGHFQMVRDGAIAFEARDGNPNAYGPRSAIGLSRDRTRLIMAVVDGRNGRRGMNEAEIAGVLLELGAHSGFGLDGGGSSTLWMQGRGVMNEPSDGSERVVGPHLAVFADGATPPTHCDRPWTFRPEAALGEIEPVGRAGGFHALTPRRLYDTRNPARSAELRGLERVGGNRVAAQSAFRLESLRAAGVPGGASAASVNLTVVDPQGDGFITLWSGDQPAPDTSVLNHAAQQNRANSAQLGLSPGDGLRVYSYAEAHHLADLTGYFAEGGAGLIAEPATRALDTRRTTRLEPNEPRQILGAAGRNERAVALGLVVVDPQSEGFMTVYPCQAEVPDVSNVNFRRNETIAASTLVATGPSGVCARSSVATHLIVDRYARFENGRGAHFQAVVPTRLVDSRRANGRWSGRLEAGVIAELDFSDLVGLPAEAVAVSLNVTAVHPAENGYAALGRCDQPPQTSTINFRDGETVAVAATAVLHGNKVCLYSHGRSHFLVDMSGYYVPPAEEPPVTPDAGSPPVDSGPAAADAGSVAPDSGAVGADVVVTPEPETDDAGRVDGGQSDAGVDGWTQPPASQGCSCAADLGTPIGFTLFLLLSTRLRRRRVPERRC